MTGRVLGRRRIWLASLGLVILLVTSVACGDEGTTPTPPATELLASPTATPSPTLVAIATSTPQPTLIVTPTVAPTPTATATPIPSPSTPSGPTPLPQTANLKLEVTSPAADSLVTSDVVTVAGVTSPDATVSVNGTLAKPDAQGRFTVDLLLSLVDNPLSIEVIATSLAGEQRSVVRTVIFVP